VHIRAVIVNWVGIFQHLHLNSTIDSCEDVDREDPYNCIFDTVNDTVDDDEIEFISYNGEDGGKPDVEDFLNDPPYAECHDEHIGLHVKLPRNGEMVHGKVVERERNPDGSLKGRSNSNQILDSRSYKVEFSDGTYANYATNTLIENS